MTGEALPAPAGVNLSVPSIARVYDFALGGKQHYKVDRKAGYQIAEKLPEARELARDCRDFVRRVVRWLVSEAGIDQIIDIGSGLPTAGNVHEIARAVRSGVRVLYVDNDPVVLAHGRALLVRDRDTRVVQADLRDPASIFRHATADGLIDLGRPVAVLVSCVLHHLRDDDDPAGLLDQVRALLSAGSYLAVANFVATDDEPRAAEIEAGFLASGLGSGRFRPPSEHRRYFDGLELVAPGLVHANDWRPDLQAPRDSPVHRLHLAGVGRVPER